MPNFKIFKCKYSWTAQQEYIYKERTRDKKRNEKLNSFFTLCKEGGKNIIINI